MELGKCEEMLAGSILDANSDMQNITPYDNDYNGKFSAKEYSFDW